MTTAAIGATVVAVAWLAERGSTWGLPMLLVGGLLIAVGLVGPRLSGSLGIRWGEDGTYLELSGVVAPPGERRRAPSPAAPAASAGAAEADELPARVVPPTEIEGSAETIEFNVEAIRAALGADGSGAATASQES